MDFDRDGEKLAMTVQFVFMIVTVALLVASLKASGPLRYSLLITAALTLVTGALNLDTTEETSVWLAFYFALATTLFGFLPWFAALYGWTWASEQRGITKVFVRFCSATLVTA